MSDVDTDYIPTTQHLAATFEVTEIKNWVLDRLNGRVLNACCGPTQLEYQGQIHRNDIDPEVPANTHVDVARLAAELEPESFDTILFDPPWSLYQANMRYDGNHVTKGNTAIKMDDLPQEIFGPLVRFSDRNNNKLHSAVFLDILHNTRSLLHRKSRIKKCFH